MTQAQAPITSWPLTAALLCLRRLAPPVPQLGPSLADRLAELVQQLLAAGADPNALDADRAAVDQHVIENMLDVAREDEDLDALSDIFGDEEPEAVEAQNRQQRQWCVSALWGRLEVTAACQAAIRWGWAGPARGWEAPTCRPTRSLCKATAYHHRLKPVPCTAHARSALTATVSPAHVHPQAVYQAS